MKNEITIVSFSGLKQTIDISQNPYCLEDSNKFYKLVCYIQARPKHYHWDVKRDVDLLQWIFKSTPKLSELQSLNTRIYWILHGIQEFKQCKNCGKNLDDKNVRSIYEGYVHEFCSDSCAASYQETKDKKAQTTFEHYGVSNCMKSASVVKKMQDNFYHRYGVKSPMQYPEFKRKFNEAMQAKYGVDWPLQNSNILSAAMQTTFEHYGVHHPLQNAQIKADLQQYFLDTYGVENPMQLPGVRQRVVDTAKQNLGIPLSADFTSVSQIPSIAQKISKTISFHSNEEKQRAISQFKKTCIEKYGVDNPLKSDIIKKQAEKTCMQRYNARNPMQCHDIQKKTRAKYSFDDQKFDSSSELAYYIWLKDNGVKFIYQPTTTFEYDFNQVKYVYCPDFYLIEEKQYVEIKGDHFFKDGKMICPWRKSIWTDEMYSATCDKYEAKHQCMLANNVKILKTSSDEVKKTIQHVKAKYGADFFVKCKI